ncbi:dolichyl-di-phosphooligosaccharide-protein glycotransferase [Colletotrichum karsti]|uniref:Dolichyl-diphosphooligosaccharide--protein glycosyltransferase subunit WBP1 n=1 Tax=Colletotrichum karsti TaxID=1095194 RepID=A0A9P6IBW3_9PEZI|nr:dolichyl-di-phosphooligosaccharide-protein glycotransferase [Colletotrichum karsti]KAF9879517.1 dolichyl-di-phosphooligosaccharide-protein glycotransferase [Colletotrichum karsti]
MRSLLSLCLLFLAAAVHAVSVSGGRLLAILDDVAEKEGYSKFLGDLESRGYSITYESPKSESLHLFKHGERVYDHVLLFPSKIKGLGPNLTPSILVQFINADGNILLTLSSEATIPTSIVSLLAELDIAVPADRTGLVVDHFNYDALSATEKHDVLALPAPTQLRAGLKSYFSQAGEVIAFPRGVGHVLGGGQLLTPILRAPKTAYIYNPKEQADVVDPADLFAAGEQLALVSAFQARNSARFTVVGSAELLSDKWFDAKVKRAGDANEVKTWNREFGKRVAGWTFKELGVLRVNEIEHHLNEAANETNPEIYRVKNEVTYSISLSEYSWDKWTPFTVPSDDDLQLEFSMLSPFHRLKLSPKASTADESTYAVSFVLPDQHGIFNFKVNYKRPFLTNLEEKNTVSVRHMAHDEWPRSYVISGAWPWLTGIAATVTGFVLFSAVWMYSAPTPAAGQTKKTQHVAKFGNSVGLKKVTRKDIDSVDIPKACETIMNPGPPLALRLSSEMLCGVVRVFRRKCLYTMNDAEKVRHTMKTIIVIWGQTGLDPKAGKTSREKITLPDDPAFNISDKIPQFSLDSGELLFPSQEKVLAGSGDKSQSQLSPFSSPIGFDFGAHNDIQLDFSQSSNGDFQIASPFMRRSPADTFLPKGRENIDMGAGDINPEIVDEDDYMGAFMEVDPNGGLIDDDDDLDLPILPEMEVEYDVSIQDQQHDLPYQDQGQGQDQDQDQDQILPDADADMPLIGSDPPVAHQEFQVPASPDQGRSDEVVAPAAKRRRVALKMDDETVLSRNVLKGWQDNYLQSAEDARLKKLRKQPTTTEAANFARHLVLGRGLFNVSDFRDSPRITFPLVQDFAGDGLRDKILGSLEDWEQGSEASSHKGRRRAAAEAFGDEEDPRNVRPRLEETPQQGRSQDDIPEFNVMYSDETIPEMGMEGPQPMAEHMSSSLMPWNQTPSVGRGSVGPGPGPSLQQSGRQLSVRGSSVRSNSLPPFEPLQDAHSSDDVGFQGYDEAQPAGLLDGIEQQNQDDAQWSRSIMDTASQDFLNWTEEHIKNTGFAKMGDPNENRRWVKFEDLCEPGQRDHTIAAQAFYHILSLATKNVISVEQDVEDLQPFGAIRVGVDMAAHLDDMN